MGHHLQETAIGILQFARGATLGFFEDLPEDKYCHQPVAGANHAMWIMGHLAHTDNFFLTSVIGKPSGIPESWDKLFGMGSQPVGDPSKYPSLDEMRKTLHERREGLLGAYHAMDDDTLLLPLEGDLKQFAANRAMMASSIAWHEGLHAGQLTMIRRSLGIAPKFG